MLDAAEALIYERGFDELTVGDLVQRSRTSVGSFYARFEDKTALLRAVQDRVLGRLERTFEQRARERPGTASLAAALYAEVEMYVTLVTRDAAFVRAFSAMGTDPVMCARGVRTDCCHYASFKSALMPHASEIQHGRPELAIRFAYSIHLSASISLSWSLASSSADFSPAETTRELTRMLLGYLKSGAPAAPSKPRARRKG